MVNKELKDALTLYKSILTFWEWYECEELEECGYHNDNGIQMGIWFFEEKYPHRRALAQSLRRVAVNLSIPNTYYIPDRLPDADNEISAWKNYIHHSYSVLSAYIPYLPDAE